MIRGGIVFVLFWTGVPALIFFRIAFEKWRRREKGGLLQTLLTGLFLTIVLTLNLSALFYQNTLRNLKAEQVAQIQIGRYKFENATDIAKIVVGLQHIEGFLPNHDREPDIPFIITLKSGREAIYRIRYRRTSLVRQGKVVEGVLIRFVSTNAEPYFKIGYGFCQSLLPVLQELGVNLE